ncbi:hypothetical protein CI610_01252 [invertebrate metagenome]|uniref:Uncharacterized protein n=1 Tax=invertebrate metagenome TaxID=1711999 RepID=A0A2H9T996_9ZZZZ
MSHIVCFPEMTTQLFYLMYLSRHLLSYLLFSLIILFIGSISGITEMLPVNTKPHLTLHHYKKKIGYLFYSNKMAYKVKDVFYIESLKQYAVLLYQTEENDFSPTVPCILTIKH